MRFIALQREAAYEARVPPDSPSLALAGGDAEDGAAEVMGAPSLASPATSPSKDGDVTESFLRQCAVHWPRRSGGRALQAANAPDAYERLCASPIGDGDAEQLSLDVERSSVDGLEEHYGPNLDDAVVREGLARLLHAWCARRPSG